MAGVRCPNSEPDPGSVKNNTCVYTQVVYVNGAGVIKPQHNNKHKMHIFETREMWLVNAIECAKPHFKSAGYSIPKVRVACGWPSRGGLANGKRTIGQHWAPEAASDKIGQIFISPYLHIVDDPPGVLATLVHELVHAVVGNENKHNKIFGKCARAVGLEGKLTMTHAGDALVKIMESWSKQLGPYPHGKLDGTKSPVKKQGTRMIKCECDECGYVCRTVRKWLDEIGAPHCPKHGEMTVDKSAGKGEGESDE